MVYGLAIFSPLELGFAYMWYGLSTTFIFAVYHVRGLSNTVWVAIVISALQLIIASSWMPLINVVVWSFGVNLPVIVLAFVFERKLASWGHWKFTVVGLIYAGIFVLLTLLAGILSSVQAMPPSLFQKNFLDGLWIGLGVGIGIEVGESIIHSIDEHQEVLRKRAQE